MVGPWSGLSEALYSLILAATKAAPTKRTPLVPFDPASPSPEANRAFARVAADLRDPAVLAADYSSKFGFDNGLRGASIREPYLGLTVADIEAVILVANRVGTHPAYVLAVWISEGKYVHRALLNGAADTFDVPETIASTAPKKVRAYARSRMLYRAFGSDHFTDYIPRAANGENFVRGVEGTHDVKFSAGLQEMRAANVHGMTTHTNSEITSYFRDSGGALRIDMPSTGGTLRSVSSKIVPDSLASWLFLQAGLYQVYRMNAEKKFSDTYGGSIDLSNQPWVTYAFWNGGPNVLDLFFTGARSAEEAIVNRFGSVTTTPNKLSTDQLDKYYSRGSHAGEPQSSAALANAVVVKYLIEFVEPWFA